MKLHLVIPIEDFRELREEMEELRENYSSAYFMDKFPRLEKLLSEITFD